MKKYKEYVEYLLESAPRLPKDVNYWIKKGKFGKDVCLIFHDDCDGLVSAIIMKNYLDKQGFKIKQYGVINYLEGWEGFRIDKRLITIALDFANEIEGCDVYIDHHGHFSEELTLTQKRPSIKTDTGSAAEGIAQQLGVPFSNDTKDWIDMIDSATYSEYNIDIKGILDFDLKLIASSPNAKLKFAAAFNQLLKRSDHKTFIEVVNSCKEPSIYNIYRLFKIFYPKNNPDWITGIEGEFVGDAKLRILQMQDKTKGEGKPGRQGFDSQGNKIRYMNQKDFLDDFTIQSKKLDQQGNPLRQIIPGAYQIIGNLMLVPSGTFANALRAKAIFNQDLQKGIVPNDPKLNFVLLQYGNTLQVADLETRIKNMKESDLPKDKNGEPISDLGKYMEGLVKNFNVYFGYQDERTVAGGHPGIGTVSNIFGKCNKAPYVGFKFLDLFKNKVINDISGVKWNLAMTWNEVEEKKTIKEEEINKKLMDIGNVRSEEDVKIEKEEREILNYLIANQIININLNKFKDNTIRKIYQIWLNTNYFDEITNDIIDDEDLDSLKLYKKDKDIENSDIFNEIVNIFNLTDIYKPVSTILRGEQRKELKRVFRIIFNLSGDKYIKSDTEDKVKDWMKK